ncbi:hypothetical protein [Streptomyces sp. CAU 1734]|uniref:hypothetical protein n=1 Tax=Streptomyces sp. CAU 1734 TaxID=3140360 RepID=UPI0032608608
MRISRSVTVSAAAAAGVTAALLAGCGNGDPVRPAPAASAAPPHGYVEGAEERAEPQSRLVLADAATGAVRVLDPATGKVTPAATVPGPRGVTTDGRFAHVAGAGGTRVIDSGAWTTDHGDHVHYYRAAIRDLGEIPGRRAVRAHGDPARTALTHDDGTTGLLDRTALERGRLTAPVPAPGGGSGPVVPYRERLLVSGTGPARDTVEIRERGGARRAVLPQRCAEPRGAAVTRRGAVLGCADGALLVSERNGTFTALRIPYPGPAPAARDRAADFRHRPGATTLAAPAGPDSVWLLDAAERRWTRVRTGPVLAANTAGEGTPLLVLTRDGVLRAYDPATGRETAREQLIAPVPEGGTGTVIEIDTSRAYVNDERAAKVYEIDYRDDLRTARTFSPGLAPSFMTETGR